MGGDQENLVLRPPLLGKNNAGRTREAGRLELLAVARTNVESSQISSTPFIPPKLLGHTGPDARPQSALAKERLRALNRALRLTSNAVKFTATTTARRDAHVRSDALTDRRVATAIAAGYE